MIAMYIFMATMFVLTLLAFSDKIKWPDEPRDDYFDYR